MKKNNATFMLAGCLAAALSANAETQKMLLEPNSCTLYEAPAQLKNAIRNNIPVTRSDNEDWTSVGTGLYTDDIMTNAGKPSESWEVEIFESASTPGFYKVENPYGNGKCPYFDQEFDSCDFLIHAENPDEVYMEYVELKNIDFGLIPGEYCPVYVSDLAGYYICEYGFPVDMVSSMGMPFGRMLGGCITFGAGNIIMDIPMFETSLEANGQGLFKIALPGASDFSFDVDTSDICTSSDLSFGYRTGADVATVKYDIRKGLHGFGSSGSALADETAQSGKVAADGMITVQPVFGVNTVTAVALEEGGAVVGSKTFYCYGQQTQSEEWKNIGKASYSEDLLASIYSPELEHAVYEVDIEENIANPGLYRLVNPYGPAYPQYDFLVDEKNILTGHDHDHYMIVDATDPERVMIEASPIGMDFSYGPVSVFSVSWLSIQQGKSPDDSEVMLDYGTLADGKITFPGGAIFIYMPDFGLPRGNINHQFHITIPNLSGIDSTGISGNEAVFYTLDGRKVRRPESAGIYIRRCGDVTGKVLVK